MQTLCSLTPLTLLFFLSKARGFTRKLSLGLHRCIKTGQSNCTQQISRYCSQDPPDKMIPLLLYKGAIFNRSLTMKLLYSAASLLRCKVDFGFSGSPEMWSSMTFYGYQLRKPVRLFVVNGCFGIFATTGNAPGEWWISYFSIYFSIYYNSTLKKEFSQGKSIAGMLFALMYSQGLIVHGFFSSCTSSYCL